MLVHNISNPKYRYNYPQKNLIYLSLFINSIKISSSILTSSLKIFLKYDKKIIKYLCRFLT